MDFDFARLKGLASSQTVVALRIIPTESPQLVGLVFAGPSDKAACRPFASACMLQASAGETTRKFETVARKLGVGTAPESQTIVAHLRDDTRGRARVIVAVKHDGNTFVFPHVRVTMATETMWKRALSAPLTLSASRSLTRRLGLHPTSSCTRFL